jgi:hypothetical protein
MDTIKRPVLVSAHGYAKDRNCAFATASAARDLRAARREIDREPWPRTCVKPHPIIVNNRFPPTNYSAQLWPSSPLGHHAPKL